LLLTCGTCQQFPSLRKELGLFRQPDADTQLHVVLLSYCPHVPIIPILGPGNAAEAVVAGLGDRLGVHYKPLTWKTGVVPAGTLPVRSLDLSGLPLLRVALQPFLHGVPKTACMWGGLVASSPVWEPGVWFLAVLASVIPAGCSRCTRATGGAPGRPMPQASPWR
jgi:hypothetical protein